MIATKTHRFPVTVEESVKIIQECKYAEFAVGSGDLLWHKGTHFPESVKYLMKLRGLNDDMNGERI